MHLCEFNSFFSVPSTSKWCYMIRLLPTDDVSSPATRLGRSSIMTRWFSNLFFSQWCGWKNGTRRQVRVIRNRLDTCKSYFFTNMHAVVYISRYERNHWLLQVSIEAPCSGPVQVGFAGQGWFLKKVVSGWLDGHFTLNHDGWMGKSSVFVGFVDGFCFQSSSADE